MNIELKYLVCREEKKQGKKRRKIFGLQRGRKTGKEAEENVWMRKMFGLQGRRRTEKEWEEMIWRRKIYGDVKRPTTNQPAAANIEK